MTYRFGINAAMIDAARHGRTLARSEGEHGANDEREIALTLEAGIAFATEAGPPLPMVLFCPACGGQHVDESQVDRVPVRLQGLAWDNPPHATHQCQHCKDDLGRPFQWRPADVATVGVASVAPGSAYVSDLAATNAERRVAIGQALTEALTSGAEAPDWFDAREVDRLLDAMQAAGARL